jgi:hypothetical protein
MTPYFKTFLALCAFAGLLATVTHYALWPDNTLDIVEGLFITISPLVLVYLCSLATIVELVASLILIVAGIHYSGLLH